MGDHGREYGKREQLPQKKPRKRLVNPPSSWWRANKQAKEGSFVEGKVTPPPMELPHDKERPANHLLNSGS